MDKSNGIEKFKNLFKERIKELIEFSNNGGHVFAYHCLFVPKEVVTASGSAFVELPWLAKLYGCKKDQFSEIERYIPHASEEFCSLCRWNFITELKEPHPKISCTIGVTTCAPLIKIISMLPNVSEHSPPQHIINLPRRINMEEDLNHWHEEVKTLKKLVEKITTKKITSEELVREIRRENRIRKLLKETITMRRSGPIPAKSSELTTVYDLQFCLDSQKYLNALEVYIGELRNLKKNGLSAYSEDAPRLLITGPTLYEKGTLGEIHEPNIIKWIEECGASIVAEDFCAGIRSFWSTISYGENPLREVSNYYASVINCACQTPNMRRVDQCLEAATTLNVDGVLYINMRTCKIFAAEVKKLEKVFERYRIPFMSVERTGDPETEKVAQLKNRIEPFIESLKDRKA